ncbi:MAG TPA: ABC transporter ATP-binding protein [Candidatus Dormibacteraeota bacterium]|nr:ABC transporter ATP-binding protein [Candidatus Dormibacteraeota bacterium]
MCLVSVEEVSLSYPRPAREGGVLRVLQQVSFQVREREFVTLIGPTGCGKTSLLRIVAGLVRQSSGKVLIDGQQVNGPSEIAAYVFQQIALLPWRTVQRNVELALELRLHRRLRAADRQRAREVIELVGLGGFEHYYPYQISGGMQQRVGIARALVTEPKLLLMDEPFGALDAQTRRILQDELLRWRERTGVSVLFVSHDLDEAVYLSDTLLVMSARPAAILDRIHVTLPEPRTDHDCRAVKEYADAHRRAWSLLRAQNVTTIPSGKAVVA